MTSARARRLAGVAVLIVLATTGAANAAPAPADTGAPVDPVVLIVHASGDAADVLAAASDARSAAIDVRHTFPADHAFSVEVPAAQQATAESALRATPGVIGVEPPAVRTFSDVTDDPQYPQESGYLDSVDAPAAWSVTHGSRSVRIAVIDSGIDVSHPDLKDKIVGTYDADDGSTNITDAIGHGTFVAGVAAAATDNGVGIAGAGYDTSLLGVKIAGPDGELSIDDEIAGINWAVKNHADIINLSLGGTDYSATEQAAVENAISKGVLVVAAAGNDGDTVKQYPAAYPGVIAVGATDPGKHQRARFSSYGSWVTLAAPGVGIRSTSPVKGSQYFPTTAGYTEADGTSFSAPLVAGAAGLLKAEDPGLTVAQLRHALVASATGLAGQGLGSGQVDFARALTHLPPTAAPTGSSVSGDSDRITFSATSASPAVEFEVDSGSWTAPVRASAGSASLGYDSWGLSNTTHTLHTRACSSFGECGSAEVTSSFTLANTAPQVTSPADASTATGRFTVTAEHPSGGGARLLLDGKPVGVSATSPYSFPVNGSAVHDGRHSLQVVACSTSGTVCEGPSSDERTVTTQSLHPVITALAHPAISPDGDGSGDTATLHFTLPDAETVTVETVDSSGAELRSDDLDTLAAGAHVWTWRGVDTHGTRLPDGRYTLTLRSRSPAGTTSLDGYADVVGRVDTVAPRLSGLAGNGVTFYPVKDGYRDTFTAGVSSSKAATVVLTIRSGRGVVVRTLRANRPAGRTNLVWNGRDSRGHLVPAGTYRWQYSVIDAAGNRASAADERVTVSGRRLVARVAEVALRAAGYRSAGGTDTCSSARKRDSSFRSGVELRNACPPGSGDFAYASYRFTVPHAVRYARLTFQVYGRSHRSSELSVAVDRVDGELEIPAYVKINRGGSHWHSVASVPAAGHIDGARHVYASVLLTGRYRGTNDFDLRTVRMRVGYTTLG